MHAFSIDGRYLVYLVASYAPVSGTRKGDLHREAAVWAIEVDEAGTRVHPATSQGLGTLNLHVFTSSAAESFPGCLVFQ
jgi:hypothetical protein